MFQPTLYDFKRLFTISEYYDRDRPMRRCDQIPFLPLRA